MSKRQERLRRQRLDRMLVDKLPYDEWQPACLTDEQIAGIRKVSPTHPLPDHVWLNSRYEVWVTLNAVSHDGWPKMHWLSIKRRDKEVIRDWRDLQRIKNDLIGPEHEAVELFPAESRLVDSSNQFHLWVLADISLKFPFGYFERLVIDSHNDGSKQREFEKKPDDAIAVDEVEIKP